MCHHSFEIPESSREPAGWPLLYNTEGAALGVTWPKGLLLHGPPGCGKTLVTRSVAAEFDAEVFEISAANVFGAYTGTDNHHQNCCTHLLRIVQHNAPFQALLMHQQRLCAQA